MKDARRNTGQLNRCNVLISWSLQLPLGLNLPGQSKRKLGCGKEIAKAEVKGHQLACANPVHRRWGRYLRFVDDFTEQRKSPLAVRHCQRNSFATHAADKPPSNLC